MLKYAVEAFYNGGRHINEQLCIKFNCASHLKVNIQSLKVNIQRNEYNKCSIFYCWFSGFLKNISYAYDNCTMVFPEIFTNWQKIYKCFLQHGSISFMAGGSAVVNAWQEPPGHHEVRWRERNMARRSCEHRIICVIIELKVCMVRLSCEKQDQDERLLGRWVQNSELANNKQHIGEPVDCCIAF